MTITFIHKLLKHLFSSAIKKSTLSFIFLTMAFSEISGQEGQIAGTVADKKNNEAMPGVNVVIKGTTIGTATDINGNYSIKAKSSDTLVFSFVGYNSEEVRVGNQTRIDVQLSENVTQLNEVVVIGYGVQKKSDLTGAVTSVSTKDIVTTPVTKIDEALEGRAAGVNIISNSGMPGGTSTIQIRGISSINGSNPLIVIDGIPSNDPNSLNRISPNNIQSIEVLKDAASAAIYGSTGGNGVILVTTKTGTPGKTKVSFTGYVGVQNVASYIKMMNTRQWNQFYASQNKGIPYITPTNQDSLNLNFDWQKSIYRTALVQNYDINVSGGGERTNFSIGGNFLRQMGVLYNTGYQKYLLNINSSHKVTEHIKFDEQVRFSNEDTKGPPEWSYQNIYNNFTTFPAVLMLPFQKPYTDSGTWTIPAVSGWNNPYTGIDEKTDEHNYYTDLNGNFGLNIDLFKGLTYTSRFNARTGVSELWQFLPKYYSTPTDNQPVDRLNRSIDRDFSWTAQNYATYNTTLFQQHNISLMLGTEGADWWDYSLSGFRQDFQYTTRNLLYPDNSLNTTNAQQALAGSAKEATSASYFGRFNYDYKSIYLLQLDFRRDGQSNFGPNYKWGNFKSGSAGFKFSELQAIKDLNIFSFGKIRIGYGETGQFPITSYWPYASSIVNPRVMSYAFNDAGLNIGLGPVQIPNPDLHWETVDQTNLGVDFGFFNNQLTGSIDYFKKENKGMIMPKQVNATAGVYLYSTGQQAEVGTSGITTTLPYVNYGSVNNNGLEVDLDYKKQISDFNFEVQLNFTYLKNKITSLSEDSTVQGSVGNEISPTTISKIGYPIGEYFGYQYSGQTFKSTDPGISYDKNRKIIYYIENGDTIKPLTGATLGSAKWVDVNGDGVINNADRTYLGSYTAPYSFGITLNLAYKGIDVSAFFQGVYGNKILNGLKLQTYGFHENFNRAAAFANRYRLPIVYNGQVVDPGDTTTNFPAWGAASWGVPSSLYLENGSYLRLKTLTIGYTLPKKWMQIAKIDRARLFVTFKNLFTLTKYTGYDPEVGNIPGGSGPTSDPKLLGLDISGYPQTRWITCGINLDF